MLNNKESLQYLQMLVSKTVTNTVSIRQIMPENINCLFPKENYNKMSVIYNNNNQADNNIGSTNVKKTYTDCTPKYYCYCCPHYNINIVDMEILIDEHDYTQYKGLNQRRNYTGSMLSLPNTIIWQPVSLNNYHLCQPIILVTIIKLSQSEGTDCSFPIQQNLDVCL